MRGSKTKFTILLAGALACAQAQWLNHPSPGTPRTRDGKADLSAKTPRAPNGKPDLSGVWQTEFSPPGEVERIVGGDIIPFVVPGDDPRIFSKYFFNILADFKPEEAPMRPETAEIFLNRVKAGSADSPTIHCLPTGLPAADILNYAPFKIIQAPNVIVMIYEIDNTHRQIHTDGRKLPVDPQPAWMGYSVGRWEGDTLVVDTNGINDRSWLDAGGHPHSSEMKLRERFRRRDFGHMDLEVTVDDPKMYTKPFTIKVTELLVPDSDILEAFCAENEKDRPHLPRP